MKRFILLFLLQCLLPPLVHAKSQRRLWIPEASAPEKDQCRFTAEEMFTPQRKSGDRAGQFFEYSLGTGCHVAQFSQFDVEVGADYMESYDIVAESPLDPLQGFARITYGQRRDKGWTVALGADAWGMKSGQNDFNILYLIGDMRAETWGASLGGYQGNPDTLRKSDGSAANTGGLIGIRRYMGRGMIGAEMMTGQNHFGYLFLGSHVQFDETIGAAVGYGLANNRSDMRDWLFLRLTFSQ